MFCLIILYWKQATAQYQGETGDCKQCFKSTVDKEGAEQLQTVVSQVFERQLEDVSPTNTAKINFFCRAVGSTTQDKELCEASKKYIQDSSEQLL